jgi:GDP-L-fucose synthase
VAIDKKKKIYIAGHTGMVGSAICRYLKKNGFKNIVQRTSKQLDLKDQNSVKVFYEEQKPDFVIICAAKVGGINANNTYKADFIYENLQIQNNLIHFAYLNNVEKLIFMGSSCIYPKKAAQPMSENELLNGKLEPTNEPYAIAKIAGVKMCESYNFQYGTNYISLMPTNMYGQNDNYNLENGHVFAAFIRKFHEAKTKRKNLVKLWGTGEPLREFLCVDDLARATVFMLGLDFESLIKKDQHFFNVGSGEEISIKNLANLISSEIGYNGKIEFDYSNNDGTPRKLLDSSLINSIGWKSKTILKEGIKMAYEDFLSRESYENE